MPDTGRAGVYIVSGRDIYLLLAETAIYRDFFVFLSALVSWLSQTRVFRMRHFGQNKIARNHTIAKCMRSIHCLIIHCRHRSSLRFSAVQLIDSYFMK